MSQRSSFQRFLGKLRRRPVAAVAVLVVAIVSGLAVAALLDGKGGGTSGESLEPAERVAPGGVLEPDSLRSRVIRDMEQVEGLGDLGRLDDLEALGGAADGDGMDIGAVVREAARHADLTVLLQEPEEWRGGRAAPVELAEGGTLEVRGVARDSRGVLSVAVDGAIVAEVEQPRSSLPFAGHVVGAGSSGTDQVVIMVTTAGGGEIRREYPVRRLPRRPEGSGSDGRR